MPNFIDQAGQVVFIKDEPQRIISLVPSQTELLYDLGLDERVIGITKFCVHPSHWHKAKTHVGGTKQLKVDIIHRLEPDIIIANKEENTKEQIEELSSTFPVWVSDVNDIDTACEMILQVGDFTNKSNTAGKLVNEIKEGFKNIPSRNNKPTAIYLIWKKPYMTVGADTFIHSMMKVAGFENLFASHSRYPVISLEQVQEMQPQYLLLSSEPFPFKEKHVEEFRKILPKTKVLLVDGEMFSWYGSRMKLAAEYLKQVISNS
jgi:ABC-type Fe3+-hydroxamate transport system substrate-binding protein